MTPSLRDRLQLLSRKGFPIEGKESESDSGFYIFFFKKKRCSDIVKHMQRPTALATS